MYLPMILFQHGLDHEAYLDANVAQSSHTLSLLIVYNLCSIILASRFLRRLFRLFKGVYT
jgi:hypothetical protein